MNVTSTRKYERVHLPLGELPPGSGWELVAGSLVANLWQRLRRKTRKPRKS